MRFLLFIALLLSACGGVDSLSCADLNERLRAEADRSFQRFEETGEILESEQVKKWSLQYMEEC